MEEGSEEPMTASFRGSMLVVYTPVCRALFGRAFESRVRMRRTGACDNAQAKGCRSELKAKRARGGCRAGGAARSVAARVKHGVKRSTHQGVAAADALAWPPALQAGGRWREGGHHLGGHGTRAWPQTNQPWRCCFPYNPCPEYIP